MLSKINRKNMEHRIQSEEKMSILLSLDGGGIRGLVLIRVIFFLSIANFLGSYAFGKKTWLFVMG